MLPLLQTTKNPTLLLANILSILKRFLFSSVFLIDYSLLLLMYFFSISYNAKILQILALDLGETLILTTVAFTQCLL